MFHRNNELGQVCDGCRYWSEMIAQSNGSGIQAYCLCRESPRYSTYTVKRDSCDAWRDGSWGAIDQPGGDPYSELNENLSIEIDDISHINEQDQE